MGSGASVGTTHFSILTANYMANVRRTATALLEWNDSEDFEKLRKVRNTGRAGGRSFQIGGVNYLKKSGNNDVLNDLIQNYDCVVIDFGVRTEAKEKLFFMCDRSFLMGSLSEWQLDDFSCTVLTGKYTGGKAELFTSFGTAEAAELMERKLGLRIRKIPWNMNPFNINGEILQFYAGLIT